MSIEDDRVRITGGVHRSRVLSAPRGMHTRPTSDRVREALFSRLEHRELLDGAKVLDLYKVRIKTLSEFPPMTDCFFTDDFALDEEGKKHLEKPESREYLTILADRLAGLTDFSHAAIDAMRTVPRAPWSTSIAISCALTCGSSNTSATDSTLPSSWTPRTSRRICGGGMPSQRTWSTM